MPRRTTAHLAVDGLADQVGVAVVPGVLLDHVYDDPAQVEPLAGMAPAGHLSHRIEAVRRGECLVEDPVGGGDRLVQQRAQLLRGVLGGAVPVPVAVGVPVDRRPGLGRRVAGEDLVEPPVLDVGHVLEHAAERHRRRFQALVELRRIQAVGLDPQRVAVPVEQCRPGSRSRFRLSGGAVRSIELMQPTLGTVGIPVAGVSPSA